MYDTSSRIIDLEEAYPEFAHSIGTAAIVMEQMYVLGMSVEEIAEIISKQPKWDKNTAMYEDISRIVREKFQEYGLDWETFNDLKEADALEHVIQSRRAKQIAQEELRKFYLEKQLAE